jgi:hypothetical protein
MFPGLRGKCDAELAPNGFGGVLGREWEVGLSEEQHC